MDLNRPKGSYRSPVVEISSTRKPGNKVDAVAAKVLRSWWTLDARLRKKDDGNLRLTLAPG